MSKNTPLTIAIAISILVHGALLAVRFVAPEAFQMKPTDPGLEVILVNAKHDKKPVKADALAQANLDGGGNVDVGRSKSPLPDLGKIENGESMAVTKRKVAEMEELQQKMLAQLSKKTALTIPLASNAEKPKDAQPRTDGTDALDSASMLKRMEAEISKRIEDENKRPKKTYISPSTKEVRYAMYYDAMRQRIEKLGTLNFPQKNGKKLYGELILSISIYQDGKIYEGEGEKGVVVEMSSGNAELDAAAKRIVRRAAPFGRFADSMRSVDKTDVWIMTTRFKFTAEDGLEAQLQGAKN